MGDGVKQMKWKIEIPSEDGVNVAIEGTNLELIQYLKMNSLIVVHTFLRMQYSLYALQKYQLQDHLFLLLTIIKI